MGKAYGLKQAYTRAVHQLTVHYNKDPEQITEGELEEYFLYRKTKANGLPKPLTSVIVQSGSTTCML